MEAFLKFIFIILVVYYLLKIFLKYGAPWLIGRFVRKQQENYNQNHGSANSQYNKTNKDEVKIKNYKTEKSKNDNDFGEYVDFEDIE